MRSNGCRHVTRLATRHAFLFATICLFPTTIPSKQAPRPSPVTTPIVYSVTGMDAVRVNPNVVYKKVDGAELAFDLYLPAGTSSAARYPVVLLISGNSEPRGWLSFHSTGRLLAASGMAAIVFDKRYSRGSYYESQSDILDLVAHLQQNAGKLGIDATRSCVTVYSGGGPLLAIFMRPSSPSMRCLVGFYPFLDSDAWGAPADAAQRATALVDFSPVQQLRANAARLPRMMLFKAAQDNPGLNATIDSFVREAQQLKAPLEFHVHATGRHGFDIIDDVPRSRELLARWVGFMRVQLGVATAP